MDRTNADRQRRWRERRKREWQNYKALLDQLAALRRERDDLAEWLAIIEAFQPGIAEKARAWVEQIDRTPRRRGSPPSS